MTATNVVDCNRPATIWSVCLLGSITPSVVLLGPLIVGSLVTELGFGPRAAGNMIFAELIGAAFATFPAFYWVSRVDWRKVLILSLLDIVLMDVVSAFLVTPWTLGSVRFLAGIGVGSIMNITLLTCGMTRNQERVLSFWTMAQIVFAAIALTAMPFVLPVIGIKGFYLILAAMMALLLIPVHFMPHSVGEAVRRTKWSQLTEAARKTGPIALAGELFFRIAVGGTWSFFERIGNAAGFDSHFIGMALAGVSVIGVLGALSAAWLSLKWGRMVPFLLGLAILATSMSMLLGVPSPQGFAVSAFLFKFGWWFITPYLLANITTLDPSGLLATATTFVIALGRALGPLAIGLTLPEDGSVGARMDFRAGIGIGLVCLVISCVLFIFVIRVNNTRNRPS